ncbi:MAG: ABC transporter permease [Acidimicrobiales bacterium]
MSFLTLVVVNVWSRRLRSLFTAMAVAIGVAAVMALGVLTTSLKQTATSILQVGEADFTIAQKNNDILSSTISEDDLEQMRQLPGIERVVGALIQTERYDNDHPGVIVVGLAPDAQDPFGVVILEGRSYTPDSQDEVMLGAVLAQEIHKSVGDSLDIAGKTRQVVGIYRTDVSFGNSTMMFPLAELQAEYQLTGQVTLGFAKVVPGADAAAVADAFNSRFIQYTAIRSASDYGRADQTLVLIGVANTGGTILAGVIAISGVLNTTLLSFFERTREFGVLRSIGWTRRRILALVIGEASVVGLVGLFIGLVFGWFAVNVLQKLESIRGYFEPNYDAAVFTRALVFAFVVVLIGAVYPAMRAAFLSPVEALRSE